MYTREGIYLHRTCKSSLVSRVRHWTKFSFKKINCIEEDISNIFFSPKPITTNWFQINSKFWMPNDSLPQDTTQTFTPPFLVFIDRHLFSIVMLHCRSYHWKQKDFISNTHHYIWFNTGLRRPNYVSVCLCVCLCVYVSVQLRILIWTWTLHSRGQCLSLSSGYL